MKDVSFFVLCVESSMSNPASIFRVKEALWEKLQALILPIRGSGRRPSQDKGCFEALVYILRAGCQYAHLPR